MKMTRFMEHLLGLSWMAVLFALLMTGWLSVVGAILDLVKK